MIMLAFILAIIPAPTVATRLLHLIKVGCFFENRLFEQKLKKLNIMKKKLKFMASMLLIAAFAAVAVSCSKDDDPDNPSNAVPDPMGTITANITDNEVTRINIVVNNTSYGHIRWYSPDNFYLYGGYYYDGSSISICNLGAMQGLGNITAIPSSGFTVPTSENRTVACEAGHGYVVKFEGKTMGTVYVRLYVVEPIVSTLGGIMGAKVKYQYPFIP
jgi:hypothetical protein